MPKDQKKTPKTRGPKPERVKIKGPWKGAVKKSSETPTPKNNGDDDTEESDDDGDDAG